VAGRYADGNGLYLIVEPSGSKRWLLRTVVQGRRRDIGLGGATLVTLGEAREKALALRKLARDGGDPLAERRKARATVPTFAEAADEAEALWTVPAARMKAGREHRVPLSARALEVLARARLLAGDSLLVFQGRSSTKPLSNMVFLMALRRMKVAATAHGFRSSFRDWAAEATNLPREVAEMALAHAVENRVEAAYRRGDLLAKRRELMQLWADFIAAEEAKQIAGQLAAH